MERASLSDAHPGVRAHDIGSRAKAWKLTQPPRPPTSPLGPVPTPPMSPHPPGLCGHGVVPPCPASGHYYVCGSVAGDFRVHRECTRVPFSVLPSLGIWVERRECAGGEPHRALGQDACSLPGILGAVTLFKGSFGGPAASSL